jgi:hypothetical protein
MKKSLITTALLGFASAAISVSTAKAATITSVPGDVVLGFYATSGSGTASTVEVDLGSATQFDNAAPGQIINLTGASLLATADLSATYGAGWATDSALNWGLAASNQGTTFPGVGLYTLWASEPETPAGTLNTPYVAQPRLSQQAPSGLIASMYTLLNGATSTTNSSVTAIEPTATANSYYGEDTQNGPGVSFGYFSPMIDNTVTNTATSGTLLGGGNASGFALSDFYLLTTANAGNNGKLLGQFQFNASTGVFRFVAVPEPSSIGLTGVGFLSLIGFVALRRRRSIMA